MDWKGFMVAGTLSAAFVVAMVESCTDTALNKAEPGQGKSEQFFGETGKNFVENTGSFVSDGAGVVMDYADDGLTKEGGASAVRFGKEWAGKLGDFVDGALGEVGNTSEGITEESGSDCEGGNSDVVFGEECIQYHLDR